MKTFYSVHEHTVTTHSSFRKINIIFTMATRKRYEPSPEQIALAKARKEKKMNKVLAIKDNAPRLLSRRWLSLPHTPDPEHPEKYRYQKVRLMTWNVCRLLLATCILLKPCRI